MCKMLGNARHLVSLLYSYTMFKLKFYIMIFTFIRQLTSLFSKLYLKFLLCFQACTGIENIDEAITLLEQNNWDLVVSTFPYFLALLRSIDI